MKKTAAVVIVIAILGLIGIADKTQSSQHQLVSPMQTSAANTPAVSSSSSQASDAGSSSAKSASAKYKDGTYTGDSEFTPYGTVQIAVVISGGKIVNVNFLQMPMDRQDSMMRTQYSEPLLKQTTIANQSANIDFVSGATDTSYGFQQSLQTALNQAALS